MKTAPLDEVSATASPLFDAAIKDAAAATGTPSPSSSSTTLAGAKSRKPKQIPTFTTGDFPCSPQKLTHLARLIKHMSVPEAHTQMTMSKKRAADRVRALLHRVRCNLKENYNQDADEYVITQAWVGKGVFLKRLKIHGRARFGIMHRPRAHLKVVVERREVGSKEVDVEFERLVKIFRRKELFVPLRDNIPLRHVAVPWSAKPWKYVTSGKWVSPENARAKRQ
ncbi:ribosomal protein L22/L17 [Fimicolochytrium jonesii]|uniref:ribosomal protein L22/L17 n=1 Tax=Fimicolochytrium jonesii TaxID=1396493 RepID=UPI0022FE3B5C|nr:ribosomal protein L22/L17 [Fimicolochytrium jonesii]KAI8817777.1 ribosomal protein L22/L17 [Fimicolochytrium jonesii]